LLAASRVRKSEKASPRINQDHDTGIICPQPIRLPVGFSPGQYHSGATESAFIPECGAIEKTCSTSFNTSNQSVPIAGPSPKSRHNSSNGHDVSGSLHKPFSPLRTANPVRAYTRPHNTNSQNFGCQRFDNRSLPRINGDSSIHKQFQVPYKNIIDLDRIARGQDTRTTVTDMNCFLKRFH
jgi:hypothetical protein